MKKSNFIFFGTPRFAEIVLEALIENDMPPGLVVTNPDRPAGRDKILTPPPVKVLAEAHALPIFQPEKLTPELCNGFKFGLVAAYGKIIRHSVLDAFPRGVIGIHPSLLPEFRGATPIQNALIEGKTETGVTLFRVDEHVDHGAIIASEKIAIAETDDYTTLEEKLARHGAALFLSVVKKYLSEEIVLTPQDESHASITKKFTREDAFIHPETLAKAEGGIDAILVSQKIKAFVAEPGAWTIQNGKQVKLLSSVIINGALKLTKIHVEGKTPQSLPL